MSTRLDNMEISIKKDIRNILDILQQKQQQQSVQPQSEDQSQQTAQELASGKPNNLTTPLYQPSESDFSFELFGHQRQQPHLEQRTSSANASQVHRSISQPECTNTAAEKSLLRYEKYKFFSNFFTQFDFLNVFILLQVDVPNFLHSTKHWRTPNNGQHLHRLRNWNLLMNSIRYRKEHLTFCDSIRN